jgi:hypothetical protein
MGQDMCRRVWPPGGLGGQVQMAPGTGRAGKLPPIKLHSARHSAISVMRATGVDWNLRKRLVGHSDDKVRRSADPQEPGIPTARAEQSGGPDVP